jgi:hypothetical protein
MLTSCIANALYSDMTQQYLHLQTSLTCQDRESLMIVQACIDASDH